ncbi:MAG: UDP-N-acetylglucosamine 1-carboxyvinyltransferase [Anaerovoracaceae bacterium]
MDTYHISGGRRLSGTVNTAGAKNAVLPLLAASIMGSGETVLHNCPALSDVYAMLGILEAAGCRTDFNGGRVRVCPGISEEAFLHEDLVRELRSSVFLLGPMLALKRSVHMGFPGGCDIGKRPVDIHLEALRRMGAEIEEKDGKIVCTVKQLRGASVRLPFPSVGATENIMMAAAMAEGVTVIRNAAREPEIIELQDFLNAMGAEISGAGTSVIIISGKKQLHGAEWTVMSDRIEAGTLILAAAVTGGEIFVKNAPSASMESFLQCIRRSGVKIDIQPDGIGVSAPPRLSASGKIETEPYPGFPTDLQSQFLAAMTAASGVSMIEENIFENRFKVLKPLRLMGADITLSENRACVNGVEKLHGARVKAEELRGGAALVIAGLAAEGDTVIENVCLIDRGYDKLEMTLRDLGADIARVKEV